MRSGSCTRMARASTISSAEAKSLEDLGECFGADLTGRRGSLSDGARMGARCERYSVAALPSSDCNCRMTSAPGFRRFMAQPRGIERGGIGRPWRISLPSIRARPRRARSCSMPSSIRSRSAQQEFRQIYPAPGHVEHDPEEIWSSVLATARNAMAKAGLAAKDIAGIGITNQRETTIVWDRATGKPLHNAIVWQDRRTADLCEALKAQKHELDDLGAHRLAARSVFLRHQDRLDPRSMSPARARRRRRDGSPSAPSIHSCSGG